MLLLGNLLVIPTTTAQDNNLKPSALNITKLDDKTATISANFIAGATLGNKIAIAIGEQTVALFDDGSNGDLRKGDGLFSTTIEFNFDEFTQANKQLAHIIERENNSFFSPGGRQQLTQ